MRRGPKPSPAIAQRRHDEPLIRENARLKHQLGRAHAIIDIQKLCVLLGLPIAEESETKD